MENKMTIAVLLSLMAVAGLAVTDVYAQSNTQRIATIDDNTEDIKGIAEDISDSVGSLVSMIATVQITLTELATTVQGMVASTAGIQASVDDVAIDVSQMSSKISTMDSALSGITAIDTRLTTIGDSLDSLKTSMSDISTGGSEATTKALRDVNARIDTTNSHINKIFEQLAKIESKIVEANQKTTTSTPTRSPIGNALLDDKNTLKVNSYHYKQHGDDITDRGPTYYELDIAFSCNKNVFLDVVDLYYDDDVDYLDRARTMLLVEENNTRNNNYVKVDGRDLFNNKFSLGGTDTAILDKTLNFNNKLLRAGDTLKFTSKIYEGNFTNVVVEGVGGIGSIRGNGVEDNVSTRTLFEATSRTKSTHLDLYQIDVNWVASETGITCSLNYGDAGTNTPGLISSDTLKYGVSINSAHENRSLKDFGDIIDCGGEPIRINKIEVGTIDDWKLPSFVKVKLMIDTDVYLLEFPDDKEDGPKILNHGEIVPLAVGSQNFKISGSIPLDNLLISIQYDTVPGAKCTNDPEYK